MENDRSSKMTYERLTYQNVLIFERRHVEYQTLSKINYRGLRSPSHERNGLRIRAEALCCRRCDALALWRVQPYQSDY